MTDPQPGTPRPLSPSPGARVDDTIVDGPGSAPDAPRESGSDPSRVLTPRVPPADDPRPPSDEPGTFGRYRLEQELGRGGMGIVYRAYDQDLRRTVALKMILGEHHGAGADVLQRFLSEARAAAKLKHSNIVEVHDIGVVDGRHYLTMDLVSGRPLSQLLQEKPEQRTITQRQAVGIVVKVARALDYAHRQGIVHRDVKPGNILVDDRLEPFVMDFGLAKDVRTQTSERLTVSGAVLGTPAYMSPEQAEARPVDGRSDLYSLGVILYEVMTGRLPFEGTGLVEVIIRVVNRDPESPSDVLRREGRRVHADLETICLKCMEKDAARRYPTAEELAKDLERYLEGEPIEGRRAGRLERLLGKARKQWPATAAVTMALLTVCAWSGFTLWQGRERSLRIEENLTRAAEEEARAHGAKDRGDRRAALEQARLALGGVLEWDREHTEARRAMARLEAELATVTRQDSEEREAAADRARSAEEALVKSERVTKVLARWARSAQPVREMERWYTDSALSAEEKRKRCEEPWKAIEGLRNETPGDPASQATMKALSGWARRLAGYDAEGLAWMRESAALDPDVPYGYLMEALVYLAGYVESQGLPPVLASAAGVEFGPVPAEGPALTEARRKAEDLLERAARARIWGKEGSEDYREALAGIRAMQHGELEKAEVALSKAIGTPALQAFESGLVLARAKVRYLRMEFAAALEDVGAVIAARPGHAAPYAFRGMFRNGAACESARRGGDVRALLREEIADYTEALSRNPDFVDALNSRGSAHATLGAAEEACGSDPRDSFGKAIADFGAALKRNPAHANAWANRGSAFMSLGETEATHGGDARASYRLAIADLGEALQRDPDFANAYASRANAYMSLGDAEAAHGGDPRASYAQAIADCGAALQRKPGFATALVNRGNARLSLGLTEIAHGGDACPSYRQAIADFDAALESNPEHTDAYFNRGNAYVSLGQSEASRGVDPRASFAQAIADYRAAMQRNPALAVLYAGLGNANLGLGESQAARGDDPRAAYAEAIAACGEALKRNPEHAAAYNCRGNARYRLGQMEAAQGGDPRATYTQAVADFGEALRRNPAFAAGYNNRANACVSLGQAEAARGSDARAWFEKAIADCGESLRRNPEQAMAFHNRGSAWVELGSVEQAKGGDPRASFAQAMADFGEALKRNPEFAAAYINRANAGRLLGAGEAARGGDARACFENSIADSEAALRLNPALWQARAGQGLAYESLGDLPRAIQAYQAALEIQPGLPVIRQLLDRARAAQAAAPLPPWAAKLADAEPAVVNGDYAAAGAQLEEAIAAAPPDGDPRTRALLQNAHYNLACIYALRSAGRAAPSAAAGPVAPQEAAALRDRAFDHLEGAIRLGWKDAGHLREDSDLAPLHADPRWSDLLRRLEPGSGR